MYLDACIYTKVYAHTQMQMHPCVYAYTRYYIYVPDRSPCASMENEWDNNIHIQ